MIDFKSFQEIKDLIDTNKINEIELVNDGPVTIIIDSKDRLAPRK